MQSVLKRLFTLLLTAGSVGLTGCGDQPVNEPITNSLLFCSDGAPETLNPQLATTSTSLNATSNHLYNRLLRFDPHTLQLVPELATHWQLSADGLEYTFFLRRDVQFHHTTWFKPTRSLNAEDVLLSFLRLVDPEHPLFSLAAGGYPFFDSIGFRQSVSKLEVIGPHQIRFTLSQPRSGFLHLLASDFAVIHSAEYATQLLQAPLTNRISHFDRLPVGTGPFKLRHQKLAHWLRLERHDEYWRGPAFLEQVVIDFTASPDRRLAKLFSGECDVASLPPVRNLELIEQSKELELQRTPGANVAYLAFNTLEPPLDQLAVRQAIAYSLDPGVLITTVYEQTALTTRRLLHMPGIAAIEGIPEQNLDKARQLLAQAGLANGFELTLWLSPKPRLYNPSPGETAELLKAQLKQIGIELKIIKRPWPQLLPIIKAGSHQLALLGWQADTSSPQHFLSNLLSCDAVATGGNASHWCDPAFEALLDQANQAQITAQQIQHWHQAEQLILQQLPLLPLATSERIQAKRVTIHGLDLPAIGGVSFTGVYRDGE